MYSKFNKMNINCLNQKEGDGSRYDYGKTNINSAAVLRGEDEKLKDCR